MNVTDKWVREYCGHNGHECEVRIQRDGKVIRNGHPDPTNRTMDYWHFVGYKDDIRKEIEEIWT